MFNQVNKQKSVVSMSQYGINTFVLTEHENLENLRLDFLAMPDSTWMEGKGKSYMHKMLQSKLLKEDAWFTKHPNKARVCNKRWIEFCDDCVVFAVLSLVIHGTNVHLVHPSQFQAIKNATPNGSGGGRPDLIQGIPFMH